MQATALTSALIACLLISCAGQQPSDTAHTEFRDCEGCPVMVDVPAGTFLMGTAVNKRLIDPRTGKPATNDSPQHEVSFSTGFALAKFEVSVAEFRAFTAATGYRAVDRCMEFSKPNSFKIRTDVGWQNTGFEQTEAEPVVCISFHDALAYANWLAASTGKNYRLPTEAEWEYAARAGAGTHYFWGNDRALACDYSNVRSKGADAISKRQAESDAVDGFPCDDNYRQSAPVGSFGANDFGLHDMQGNAWEWVADCNHKDYAGAPTDGSAWLADTDKECRFGIIRGGSFLNLVERSSVTVRAGRPRSGGATNMGFRVALGAGKDAIAVVAAENWVEEPPLDNSPGAALFTDNCAACHRNARGFEGLYGKDQNSLVTAIRDGGNNVMSMPAFADRLSDAEIATVADYLRATNNWD